MSGDFMRVKPDDNFTVEYDWICSSGDGSLLPIDPRQIENSLKIAALDQTIADCQGKIDAINAEVDRLTNHADELDYLLAVASGTLTGLLDIFFVGELDMRTAKANVNRKVNNFIEWYAESKGYKGEGRLKGAIIYLENHYKVAQDNVWNGIGIDVTTKSHHLDDLAHHPTIVGLVAAVAVQFLRCGIFVDKNGEWHFVMIETKTEDLVKIWSPIIISGILLWLTNLAKNKYQDHYGEELPKPIIRLVKALAKAPAVLELLRVVNNWISHLVSDMGGSRNTPGGGMGIPGIFISLLKEISSIPPLNHTKLPQIVNDLYVKQKIDLRTEFAFISELGRQAVPVMLNELLVRGFYFVRRLLLEVGDKKFSEVNWSAVNWQNVIPFNNRTINRMITIASGTFTAIDAADAAIRAAMKSGGNPAVFWAKFALRINFVGVGRFVVALGTDLYMGYQRKQLIAERMTTRNYLMVATNAKMFYYEANMWISAQKAGEALAKTYSAMEIFFVNYTTTAEKFKLTGQSIDAELAHMEQSLDVYNKYL